MRSYLHLKEPSKEHVDIRAGHARQQNSHGKDPFSWAPYSLLPPNRMLSQLPPASCLRS